MRMLMLVFRSSLEEEMLKELDELGVKAFTQHPTVLGSGLSGKALNTLVSPSNSMVWAAMEDAEARRVALALKKFQRELKLHQQGAKIPLRIYIFPCEEIV
jgi:nitrogen regulatory protein PII